MPCEDVTEVLSLTLNGKDQLVSYELNKRTCGRGVGDKSLLGAWSEGRAVDALLGVPVDDFLDEHPTDDEGIEYLYLKHFLALRSALRVIAGVESGGASDYCSIETLVYDHDRTELVVQISVDVLAKQIKSCGRCGKGCGKKSVRERASAG